MPFGQMIFFIFGYLALITGAMPIFPECTTQCGNPVNYHRGDARNSVSAGTGADYLRMKSSIPKARSFNIIDLPSYSIYKNSNNGKLYSIREKKDPETRHVDSSEGLNNIFEQPFRDTANPTNEVRRLNYFEGSNNEAPQFYDDSTGSDEETSEDFYDEIDDLFFEPRDVINKHTHSSSFGEIGPQHSNRHWW